MGWSLAALPSTRESLKSPYCLLRYSIRMLQTTPTLSIWINHTRRTTASASHPDGRQATAIMANHKWDVETWVNGKEFQMSAEKSTETLFTLEIQQGPFHPHITIDGELLSLDCTSKILSVTFNHNFHFHRHVWAIEEKAKKRLSLLKASAGTN